MAVLCGEIVYFLVNADNDVALRCDRVEAAAAAAAVGEQEK